MRGALPAVGLLLLFVAPAPVLGQGDAPESPSVALARELIGPPAGRPLAGDELDRVTHDVAALMRCPVCQGLSVADSPTTSALAMRAEARELLAAGFSQNQVLAYFERSYGEFIRLSPKPEGFNLVVWILPVAALLAGALVIALRARRRPRLAPAGTRARAADENGAAAAELAAYMERVRREVGE